MIKIYTQKKDKDFGAIAAATCKVLGLIGKAAVDLEFVDADEIARLNKEYRGKNQPTDVLSFPMLSDALSFSILSDDLGVSVQSDIKAFNKKNYPLLITETGEVLLGGIAICISVAQENAAESGHSARTEICYLFVHGLLHLLGFDHMNPRDQDQMKKVESLILTESGVKF